MARSLQTLLEPLRRLLAPEEAPLPVQAAAEELKQLYWDLRDAADVGRDARLTARARTLGRSLEHAARALEARAHVDPALVDGTFAAAQALAAWPILEVPFDGVVIEGPLTRETASVVALTAMRRAEDCARALAPPRPRRSAPPRLRPA